MKKILATTLVLLMLTGCGVATSPSVSLSTQQGVVTSNSDGLSAAELKVLEARSPDRLIENAPEEPGMKFWPKPPSDDLGNQGQLEATLWRGARPTEEGMRQLAAKGTKLIVNLENDKKVVQQEEAWAKKYGIRFVNIPLSIITPPSQAKVDQFLALATDPQNRPLYFHCMQGRDRTGTMAFVYRVHEQGWNYDRAYQEMVQYKFHTYLLGLRYFLIRYAKHHAATAVLAPI